eukprot:7148635-Alexandrium_andersonii.AAC.1
MGQRGLEVHQHRHYLPLAFGKWVLFGARSRQPSRVGGVAASPAGLMASSGSGFLRFIWIRLI